MLIYLILIILSGNCCQSTPIPNLQFTMYPTPFNFLQPRILPQGQFRYANTESQINAENPITEQNSYTGINQEKINNALRAEMANLPGNQRQIIGTIISAIPFLPIQINVPDAIAAFVSGVQGIVGNIGQRFPILNNWVGGQVQTASDGMMAMSLAQMKVGPNGEQLQTPMIVFVPMMVRQSRSHEVTQNGSDDDANSK